MRNFIALLLGLCAVVVHAQEITTYQRPPEELVKLVEAPTTPLVTFSPDRTWMLLLERSDYPSIEELSRPELRIAGLRINPENFGPSRSSYTTGLKLRNVNSGNAITIQGLPTPLLASSITFSPDGKKIAFLQSNPDKIELWLIDIATQRASRITDRRINTVLTNGFSWLSNSRQLLFTAVPVTPRKEPVKSRVPEGPTIEENLGKKAPSRTYQDLLKNPYDEAMFDYVATSDLVLKNLDGGETALTAGAINADFNPSPDGTLILSAVIHKPYSYLVPADRFPYMLNVIDLTGKTVKTIVDVPLTDYIPNGFNAVQREPRNHNWRADKPATLYWAQAQDGGDPKVKAAIRDKVFAWDAPFTAQPTELISLTYRYAGITWGNDQVAFVTERWTADRKERIHQLNPATGTAKLLFDRNYEEVYTAPGAVVTAPNAYGRNVMVVLKDNSVYFTGNGSSPEGDMPFLDKRNLTTGKTTRLWRCEAPYYERVVTLLDPARAVFVTSRESVSENPNYYLRTAGSKKLTRLTDFAHPYPQLKDVTKEVLHYKRADGVDLTATMYLPAGYKKEDGPLPGFVWAYPREFKSASAAGQVTGSPYTFTRISWGSPIYWVTRGYVILDNASIPIVGEGDKEPNDTYIEQLVSSAKAVVEYAAARGVLDPNRVGVGGHSYGAFMTANLLAHANIFQAGIARSGAYNRTLTPFGFQAEERTYWEAPEVYYNMSPFSFADKIKTPLLMTHGEADNNSGTFPIQSERLYNAIKGHGGTVRFVKFPYEAHGYAAKESVMHMLWEMDRWLETYVKNPKAAVKASTK